jgi:POT family proton-dependent oligopeptide transporter
LYPDGKTTYVAGIAITNLYDFFMMFVVMAGVASLILFLLASKLKKMME